MPLVVDASVVLAWLFRDEQSELAERAIEAVLQDSGVVPGHLFFEVANSFASAVRAGRTTVENLPAMVRAADSLQLRVVHHDLMELARQVVPLARAQNLSVYDAAYLHLASREGVPLATLDARLRAAATAAGCALFA